MIIENKGLLIYLLEGVFGVGNKFTTRDVFYAINNVAEPAGGNLRKVSEDRKLLRDEMLTANKAATTSVKSLGHVMKGIGNQTSEELRLIRRKTKSKKPVEHWIEFSDDDSGADSVVRH